jgi:hypothetical protein
LDSKYTDSLVIGGILFTSSATLGCILEWGAALSKSSHFLGCPAKT